MKQTNAIIGMLLILFINNFGLSQDMIHKTNGDILSTKVTEIGTDEIKYKLFDEQEGPAYVIEKVSVAKVVYESGRTENYVDNFRDPALYAHQNRNALKVGFLAPLFGNTNFTFERNLQPGKSIEAKIGFIGVGRQVDAYNKAGGFYASAGYKFYKTPNYHLRGMRYSHLLKGGYVKPEIVVGGFTNKYSDYETGRTYTENIKYGALMLNFGKQWVFSDVFLVEINAGVGYGFSNTSGYHYNLAIADSGIAGSLGLNIGFLF